VNDELVPLTVLLQAKKDRHLALCRHWGEAEVVDPRVGRPVARSGVEAARGIATGHVLAHELAHVLQGFTHHSEAGVTKARWDSPETSVQDWEYQHTRRILMTCFAQPPARRLRHPVT
jgi:hypothetical protein